jgi:hypothetical protein
MQTKQQERNILRFLKNQYLMLNKKFEQYNEEKMKFQKNIYEVIKGKLEEAMEKEKGKIEND